MPITGHSSDAGPDFPALQADTVYGEDAIQGLDFAAATTSTGSVVLLGTIELSPPPLQGPTFEWHVPPREIAQLKAQLSLLAERVKTLEAQLQPRVVVLREVSDAEAREELLEYFAKHHEAYPSDAALALRIDAELARDVCRQLMQEGLLEG